jgi:hypothetical protein
MNTVICNSPRNDGNSAAAPSYLAKRPRIDEPGDLAKQQIIAMNNSGVGA